MTLHHSPLALTTTKAQPIPESKFDWHGTDRGYRYGKLKRSDQWYAVTLRPIEPEHHTLRPGELLVTIKRDVVIDGRPWDEVGTHLAVPVDEDAWPTIEQRQKAREARRKGTDRPLRTWSALADLFRPRSEPTRLALGKVSDDPTLGAMQNIAGVGGPTLLEIEPKTVDTSPAGVLAYFADKGVELSLGQRDGTRLVARSRLPMTNYDRTLLHRMEPLLVAELGGPQVKCTECPLPAVQPIEPRAWACAEHSA